MIDIKFKDALHALSLAVREKGLDHVYVKTELMDGWDGTPKLVCSYLECDADGNLDQPSCIVGNVLMQLGVTADQLREWNTGMDVSTLHHRLRENDIANISPRALHLLQTAQIAQDSGETWGEAFRKAVTRATNPTLN